MQNWKCDATQLRILKFLRKGCGGMVWLYGREDVRNWTVTEIKGSREAVHRKRSEEVKVSLV